MKKPNQSGFAAIEAVLILVIVAMLAGTGYFVWHAKQNTDKTLTDTANSQPALQSKKNDSNKGASNTSTENAEVKYLTITEWGVKLKLNDSTTDAYYQTSSFDPGYIFLSTEALKPTTCNADNGGAGFIKRFQENEMNSETKRTYKADYPDAVKFGNYYYGYGINPAYEECSTDSAVQTKANMARQALKQALTSIQSAN